AAEAAREALANAGAALLAVGAPARHPPLGLRDALRDRAGPAAPLLLERPRPGAPAARSGLALPRPHPRVLPFRRRLDRPAARAPPPRLPVASGLGPRRPGDG